ncbi:MAG: GNAT family N-acetyltransferase [Proteobacteria bacterium]|nr:GNAT family N-acetyltransferase [Pseudomonadota bacterium]
MRILSDSLTVSAAQASDIPQIVAWQMMMALESEGLTLDINALRQGVTHVIESPKIGQYYLAAIGGRPVGCALTLYEWSDWRCGEVVWIHSVYVENEHRRSGVFSKIYEHIKGIVSQTDRFRGLRLYVDKSNLTAQKTYEALGMTDQHYKLYEWMKTF